MNERKKRATTAGLDFSSCTFHFHDCKCDGGSGRGGGARWLEMASNCLGLRLLFIGFICCRATQNRTTFLLNLCYFLYLLQGHEGKDHKAVSIFTRQEKHLACDTQPAGLYNMLRSSENEQSVSWVQLFHYTSRFPVSGAPSSHLMWFLGPERQQRCQQSRWCLSCSLSKGQFFCLHKHAHVQQFSSTERAPLPRKATTVLRHQFLSVICCSAPEWLSVSLFRSSSLLALGRRCHHCMTAWCLFLISALPLTAPTLNILGSVLLVLSHNCIPIMCYRALEEPSWWINSPVSHLSPCF